MGVILETGIAILGTKKNVFKNFWGKVICSGKKKKKKKIRPIAFEFLTNIDHTEDSRRC